MLVNTSRWTGESSNHPRTSGPSPDPMLNSAQKTPKPMTRWYGRTRDFIPSETYSPPDLCSELTTPVAASAVRLLVERADLLCERGEQLVRQLRHLVEHRGELARSENEHGDRCLGHDGGGARPFVEQRQLAEVRARAERRDLASVALDLHLALDEDEALPPDVALFHQRAP